jgi:hypothetical protein
MNAADGSQVPSQVTSGYVQDTSDEAPATHPQYMATGAPIVDPGVALRDTYAAEINRLNTFLMTAYPREISRSNVVAPESPVDIAIRLLQGLSTVNPGRKCPAEYCNLQSNHDGDHGFVNYSPR